MRWTNGIGRGGGQWRCINDRSATVQLGWSTRAAVIEPVRHRVAANARDLHSLALRDALPGAADRSVTVPTPLQIACLQSSMVAQTRRAGESSR
ncbi:MULTISPECIES: hypothetical protein [Xanthomonas]|uniref:hypothetical protein n=1 Tax=Xanthomonas TaxID=338 RepID=UPI001EEFDD70|nr:MULTISPECIES: hypothetical protein [Xanthomonas]WLA29815.1 hypothetical protein NPS81_01905 [Xanthomonas citri pv. glycines]